MVFSLIPSYFSNKLKIEFVWKLLKGKLKSRFEFIPSEFQFYPLLIRRRRIQSFFIFSKLSIF